ncbi:MAG: hypothetical protein BHW63_01450 [Mycoplasma sp. CAG:611_25_7]|nr:MAG: hypothetical protein BHW63_01450 [Mycoplasma sp. CAG:611_25_7]
MAFSVLRTFPRSGNIAWNFLSLPPLALPPAESPSTKNNSFFVLSFPLAGVNLSLNNCSFFFVFPFLTSSLAFLAASLANLLFKDLSIISSATFLFSSRKLEEYLILI